MKLYFETSNFPWSPERYHYAAEQMMLTLFPGERPEYPEGPPPKVLSGEGNAVVFTLRRGEKQASVSALVFRNQERFDGVRRLPSEELDRPPGRGLPHRPARPEAGLLQGGHRPAGDPAPLGGSHRGTSGEAAHPVYAGGLHP